MLKTKFQQCHVKQEPGIHPKPWHKKREEAVTQPAERALFSSSGAALLGHFQTHLQLPWPNQRTKTCCPLQFLASFSERTCNGISSWFLASGQPAQEKAYVCVSVCSVEEKMWNHLEWSTHLILPVLWVCDAKIEELACKSSSPLAVITFQLVAFYFSGCWWMVSAGELGCLKGALAAMGRRGMCVFMFLPCAGCWNDAVTHWPGELVLILVIPPFCKHWCNGQSSWRQVGWSTSYQEQSVGVSNTWFAAVFLVTVPFSSPTAISKSKGSKDPFLIYVTYNQHCVRHLTVPFTAVWETLFLVL